MKKRWLLTFLILILTLSTVQPVQATLDSKARRWVDNGRQRLLEKDYREALYCFYMASYHAPDDQEVHRLVGEAQQLLRHRGPSLYLVPREPFKFEYIPFEQETAEEITPLASGSTKLPDGSSIALAPYVSKVAARTEGRKGYWGDGKLVLSRGDSRKKLVGLTFDDGPHATYTPKLLDILKKHNVPATFFVLGQNVKSYPAITRRTLLEGHTLANHSWNHPNMARLSEKSIHSQLDRTDEAIAGTGGPLPVRYFRPPYGSMSKKLVDEMRDTGKFIVLWSIDTRDWQHPSAATIMRNILNNIRPGDIILLHDIHPQAVYICDPLIRVLKQAGYEFVSLDRLFAMQELEGGRARPTFRDREPVQDVYAAVADFGSDMSGYSSSVTGGLADPEEELQ